MFRAAHYFPYIAHGRAAKMYDQGGVEERPLMCSNKICQFLPYWGPIPSTMQAITWTREIAAYLPTEELRLLEVR